MEGSLRECLDVEGREKTPKKPPSEVFLRGDIMKIFVRWFKAWLLSRRIFSSKGECIPIFSCFDFIYIGD